MDLEFLLGMPVNPASEALADAYMAKCKAEEKEFRAKGRKMYEDGILDMEHYLKTMELREKPAAKVSDAIAQDGAQSITNPSKRMTITEIVNFEPFPLELPPAKPFPIMMPSDDLGATLLSKEEAEKLMLRKSKEDARKQEIYRKERAEEKMKEEKRYLKKLEISKEKWKKMDEENWGWPSTYPEPLFHPQQQAIKLERNPGAFRPKTGKSSMPGPALERGHNKGCNCKRSRCLKNNCECYEAKIFCSGICKCIGCKNCRKPVKTRNK